MITILLLIGSNVFMTFAWYGHLKNLQHKPLIVAILISWGIAFFEYLLQVPANRIGYKIFSLGELKIIQEIITMTVFAAFAYFYMDKPLSWNYLYAGLCMVGAAFFIFRDAV
jgi:uncharacterized protein (DUF486 family)